MQKQTEERQSLIRLGLAIRALRKGKGITQEDIAALCNSEKASISRIEAGKTNLTILTLKKIADAMNVPLAEMFI